MRMAAGLTALVAPRQTVPLFGLAMSTESSMLARLFGSRDLVLGYYLWKTVKDWQHSPRKSTIAPSGSERTPLVGNAGKNNTDDGQAGTLVSVDTVAKQNVITAVWLGLACDAIDVVSVAACALEGNLEMPAVVSIGSAGAVLTSLAAWQVWALRAKDGEEEA